MLLLMVVMFSAPVPSVPLVRRKARAGCTPEDGASRQRITQPCMANTDRETCLRAVTHSERQKMALVPEDGTGASAPQVHHSPNLSSATSSCWWAGLASIPAAPILLWRTPSCHPIGKASIAIIGRAGCTDWGAAGSLTWAALSVNPAAPFFLWHTPPRLPVGEAICAIVWVYRASWNDGCWKRHRHRDHWRCDWPWATDMVNPAAPSLLVCLPSGWCVHCAIEGVTTRWWGARRCWRSGWRCWRWRRRRRWRWSLRDFWQRRRRRASNPCGSAAVLFLHGRPHSRGCRDPGAE